MTAFKSKYKLLKKSQEFTFLEINQEATLMNKGRVSREDLGSLGTFGLSSILS